MPDLFNRLAEVGERKCEKCGRPHNAYYMDAAKSKGLSWADPDDGHAYYPESWEKIARRLMAEQGPSRD